MNGRDFLFGPKQRTVRQMQALASVGGLTLLAGLVFAPQQIWLNLLLVSYYLLGLSLAGMVWVAVQYVSGAHWSTALRRVPEAMAGLLPLAALGILAVLLFHPSLYPWTGGLHSEGEAIGFKKAWLSLPFFRVRAVIYLLGWLGWTWAMLRSSRLQDADGELRHTRTRTRLAASFLVFFGITFCLASFDWIMSLEPEWYSTIFGFYNFAGLFVSGLAVLTLLLVWLQQHSRSEVASSAATSARCGQAAVRLQHLLGLPVVLPVHADLVREPARRDGLLHPPPARILAAAVCPELLFELGGAVLRAAAADEQAEGRNPGESQRRVARRTLAGPLPDDHAAILGWKTTNWNLGDRFGGGIGRCIRPRFPCGTAARAAGSGKRSILGGESALSRVICAQSARRK